MAVSGLDMAFWDAIARNADQPVVSLLGGTPVPLAAYDSYGMIDPKGDEKTILRSIESGFDAIKINSAKATFSKDVTTVPAVRLMIGPAVKLMIDYNQSLDAVEECRMDRTSRGF